MSTVVYINKMINFTKSVICFIILACMRVGSDMKGKSE